MATPAGEGTSYQGGAGGKFRKKPFKKPQTTPYDRPPTALRGGGGGDSWVSKMIVDPASKLITAGAHLFFSSMFQKRLPPPPSGANEESGDRSRKTVTLSPVGDQGKTLNESGKQGLYEDQGLNIKDSGKQKNTTDSTGLSELELMLKQKTFTRSEIDRLTELLHSRTVESSNGGGVKNTEFRPLETVSAFRGLNSFARSSSNDIRSESHLDKHRYHGRVSTAVVSSKVLEDDVVTPVELAKAYMGNGSSKVSPSVLGLRSQAVKEEPGALCNSPFAPRSPAMSLVQKPSVNSGVLENGFVTPRSRGRSAIYSMARTPYSRVHPTAFHDGNGSIFDGYGGPSASSSTGFARELVARSVSKDLALKRRSSVLDDDIGSVGPIRRLRQKTNLSTPNNMSLRTGSNPFPSRGTGLVSNGALDPSTSSKTSKGSEDNKSMPGTSHTPVPSQSKETARKILQQLQMLSPKEKQFEGKVGALSEKSPSKLMPNMLHGQALRSLEDVDSSKILPRAGYSLEYTQKDPLPDACESSSQRQDKVEENGPKSFNVSHGSLAPAGTSNGTVPFKETVPTSSFSDPVEKQTVDQSSPKKWGFQMSAHEDFFELDDEIHSNEDAASVKLAKEKKILETTTVDSKVVPVTEDKTTSVAEFKAPTGSSKFLKPTSLATSDGPKVVEKNNGFMFSAATGASTSFPPVASVSQSTIIAKNAPDKEPDAHPLLSSSGAKVNEKSPPLNFSSTPSVGESLDLKSTPPEEAKQETTNSLAVNASGTTETVPKPADSNNGGIKNTQKPGDTVGRPESLFSLPQSTSSLFTGGSSTSFSSLSDGLLNITTPSLFSSSLPIHSTSNSGNQTLPNPFTGITFLTKSSYAPSSETSASTSATASSLLAPAFTFESTSNSTPSTTTSPTPPAVKFGSTSNSTSSTTISATPSLTTTPDFKSGSSFMAPSTYSTVSTTSSATDVKASTEKEASLGDLPSNPNPFGATSVPMASIGSSIFGFSAGSTSSSSAASPSLGSLFGTSSVTAVSSQSMPVFGSSAPSSTLGASGSTPFATGSSIFSSSTSSVFGNATSSSFVFGSNSTSSSSLFSSSTSSNSLFGLSTSKDTGSSSSFGLGTSPPLSTGFSFGVPPSQAPAFGPSTSVSSSSSFFSFSSPAPTQPIFGSSVVPAFGSVAGGNNDQMTMAEDSMAEDQVPAGPTPTPTLTLSVPVFGQPLVSNPSPSPFMFGQTPPSSLGTVPFQFGGQQSQPGAQNPNPFQPSGSHLDFGGGGSFSLGSGGGGGDDKSSRRKIRVKHSSRKK